VPVKQVKLRTVVLKEHLFADGLGKGVGVGVPALLQQRLRPELKHVRALTKPGAMRNSFCFNSASSETLQE
jgi:hypothetical protein